MCAHNCGSWLNSCHDMCRSSSIELKKKKKNVQPSLDELWIEISHYLQKTPSREAARRGFKRILYFPNPDTLQKIGEKKRARRISGRPVMASCLGNCIRQPNIKALNIQGALRWRELYKWIIPPWVNTRNISTWQREKWFAFGKLQHFKMKENGNKKRE